MRWECQEIEQFFSDYLETSLSAGENEMVREHLRECPSCLDLMNALKQTLALCEEMPQFEPPAQLIDQILIKTSGRVQSISWRDYLLELVRPLYASPRFATGFGMAAISLALVLNSLGFSFSRLNQIRLSDLTPRALYRNVEQTVNLAYDNGVRRLNDLKLLYEIQQRIDELRTQNTNKKENGDKKTVTPAEQRPESSASAIEQMMAWNEPMKGIRLKGSPVLPKREPGRYEG
jgi:hypothetical protein